MKHKLLSLIALAGAMFMSVSASAWDAPKRPAMPTLPEMPSFNGTWVTPENEGTYYIYNVGTGQFLGAGMNWGTRAVVGHEGVVALDDEEAPVVSGRTGSGTNNPTYVLPFKLSHPDVEMLGIDEKWASTWFIQNQNTDVKDYYLCHEGNAAWIDGGDDRRNTDNNGFWNLQAVEDNGYYLLPIDGQEGTSIVFGVHLTNMDATVSYTWTDLQNNETAAGVWKFVSADDAEAVKTYCEEVAEKAEEYNAAMAAYKEALVPYNEEMAVYNARVALYNTLLEADKYGVSAGEAGTVYNNAEATVEEINAANEALIEAIKPAAIEYGCKNSSEDNPYDVTNYVMTNADFSTTCDNGKTPPGWEITITGNNVGQQNRTDTNSETGASITNFLEAWTPQPNTLGNGYAGQWITGLPQGRYRLEMDATACQESGNIAIEDLTGVYLFVGTGSYNIVGDPVQTGDRMVQHYTFDFDFNADKLLVGLLVENTNCNWISADNFKLSAIGAMKTNPTQEGLKSAIAKAEETLEEMSDNNDITAPELKNVNKEVATAFKTAIENAKTALNGSDDEMKAAVEALATATSNLEKSIEIHQSYLAVYNAAMEKAQQLQDLGQWKDLMFDIWDFTDAIQNAFNEGLLTEDYAIVGEEGDVLCTGLEEAQGYVYQKIIDFIGDGSSIQPGDDLTFLVQNADFSEGSGATNIPGWTIASGSITELSAAYHNIEAYQKSFDFQQTIKNMPMGTYRITVQGFVRIESGSENNMVLYAGASEKKFMEITEEYSETALLTNREDGTSGGGWPYDTPRGDGLGYQPNSMQGADIYFNTINPATGKPFYLNDVEIAHTGGDLTIGVKCSTANLWILWDNFTLSYVSGDAIVPILEQIREYDEQLNELMVEIATNELRTQAEAITERIAAMDNISTMEEAVALLNDVKQLMEDIKADQAKYQEILALYDQYSVKVDEAGITDESFIVMLDEVNEKIMNYSFENGAEIDSYMEKMQQGWIPAVIAGKQPGDDVTAVINNPDFELGNASYWNIIADEEGDAIGVNQGYQGASYSNDEDGLTIEHFIEAWRSGATLHNGVINQTFAVALPEGAYTLGVDGYAVNQSGVPEEGVQGAYLYAQVGESMLKTSICVDATAATPTHFEVSFYSNGEDKTTIGILIRDANFNWVAVDNFTLTYLGSEIPDAVEGLNAVAGTKAAQVFSLDGRQQVRLSRGVNIVRMSDGSVRKVLVK